MAKRKLRTLKGDAQVFFWRVDHVHVAVPTGRQCVEVFSAFLEGYPRAPVRFRFPQTAEHGGGYPGNSGEVIDYRAPAWALNLHAPRVARLLVEVALGSGWSPQTRRSPMVLENGFEVLRAYPERLAEYQVTLPRSTS